MAYNSFPYTNFHELNLDYLLNKSKEIEGNVQETADNVLRATQQADRATQQANNSQNSAAASANSAAASAQSAINSANSAAASAQSATEARAAAGDPKTFTAATQLTDTTKIYVYVGETGTYTYGHYYYYQGGTWHDGGVYGTWATDDALSDTSTNAVQNRVVNAAVSELKSDLTQNIDERLTDIDGIIVPNMELGTIAMSSSGIVFNNSTTNIRTPQTSGVRVAENDVIGLTDYVRAKYRYALLRDDTSSYVYTSEYLTSDTIIHNAGTLYLVVAYSDNAEVTQIEDLAALIRITTTTGKINALDSRVKSIEAYNTVNIRNSLPDTLFGPGTYGDGVYNPTFRPYRLSTVQTISFDFDLFITAGQGYRFICYQFVNGYWLNNSWVTSSQISANTPFGLMLARVAAEEDTTSTATAEEFLPHYEFNTNLTNKITELENETIELDVRVTALEQTSDIDSEKVAEYMYHFYSSNIAEAYAFFTDPHLMGSAGTFDESTFDRYINVLSDTVKQTSASYIVCGGDWLNSEDSKAQASAKLGYVDGKMRELFPGKYYPIVGNHDFNYLGYENGSRLPENQWISNSAMRNYWFHDHEQCYYKFRRMTAQNYVLNTRTDYDGTNTYDKSMLDWLAQNLIEDDAPHSTIMFHMYYLSTIGTTIPKRVVAIGKIIEAYNSHSVCTLTDATEGYDKTYDFTETTGHIDYVIVGHTHADFNGTFGGVPIVGCDNFTDGGVATFDLVFADYTNHKLYLTRIGTGASRSFDI